MGSVKLLRIHAGVFILLVPYYLCLPVNNTKLSNVTATDDEEKYKKGTIRIAGPWHSDSALDRNVDAGEDSYVKKIISSNEGINFNKDIAEAGEMFDVNGIEDFYDKNAMITYEINGHEIPVHMRPKLTPQSKSLFPEYSRDSPASMGLVRGAKASALAGGIHQKSKNRMSHGEFSGINTNELSEYKNSGSRLANLDSGRASLLHSIQSYTKQDKQNNLKLPWKTMEGSARLNKVEGLGSSIEQLPTSKDLRHRVFEDYEKPKYFRNRKPVDTVHSGIEEFHHRFPTNGNRQGHIDDDEPHGRLLDDNTGLKHRVPAGYEKKLNGDVRENQDDLLFQKLETLHKNLVEDKEVNDADMRSMNGDVVEPQKVKAKARILNLLGELTDKLKGMESIVSGNKEKKVEKFISDRGNQDQNVIESDVKLSHENEIKNYREHLSKFHDNEDTRYDDERKVSHETEMENLEKQVKQRMALLSELNGKVDQNKMEESSEVKHQNPQVEDDDQDPHRGEENAGEQDNRGNENNLLMNTFRRIGSPTETHHSMENNKHASEIIEKFRDHDKPFVMNTNAIDFKPETNTDADDSDRIDQVNSDGEEEISVPALSRLHRQNSLKGEASLESDRQLGKVKLPNHGAASLRHKHTQDEDSYSRQTLLNFRKKVPASDNDDDQTERHIHREDEREDNDDYDDDDERSRRHKSHHHHRYHDEEDKNEPVARHHHRHDKSEYTDEDGKDVKEEESKKLRTQEHHYSDYDVKDDQDGAENAKMSAVEEDLADADEKSGISRERSFRPRVREEDIQYPDYNDVKDAAIFETNLLRKNFHAKTVHWSDRLSDRAQKQAETLARLTDLNEKNINAYKVPGEDVALVSIDSTNVGKDAPELWARGAKNFDFRSPQITSKNSDFAQLMWKSNNEFGLGVAKSKTANNWIVTSMFDTPVIDRFKDLKLNLESDIPIDDPYSDIVG